MNPYSKDTHSLPEINVNVKPCQCPWRWNTGIETHESTCPGIPVLVPLSLQPFRSVTFEVRLGECQCSTKPGPMLLRRTVGLIEEAHEDGCPAHPIRVSCSISGKTWAESEVAECETAGPPAVRGYPASAPEWAACHERWALVKALVLGQCPPVSAIGVLSEAIPGLVSQRDAMFSALVKARQHEDGLYEALGELPTGIASAAGRSPNHRFTHAEEALKAYVTRLIEQVGVLDK